MIRSSKSTRGTPIYLCGLSMGGLMSFNIALKCPKKFKRLILVAPALKSCFGGVTVDVAKFLSFPVPFSCSCLKARGNGKHGSKNPDVSENSEDDPHRYTSFPYASTVECVLSGMK